MALRKSKNRDAKLVEILTSKAISVKPYESTSPLLEQIIECILEEGDDSPSKAQKTKKKLMDEFVDWNEVRIVTEERLEPYFKGLEDSPYKLKVLQAVLNKIFSRTGSLEYQFLLDFEPNDLEDYMAGILELRENTRKMLILNVFKKQILPFTSDHEVVFEEFGTAFHPGDDTMVSLFEDVDVEILEGMRLLFDQILKENEGSKSEEFKSTTLNKIIKEANI